MSKIDLPAREPFREMMVCLTPTGIELVVEVRSLIMCRHWEATFLDLHAAEFTSLPGNLLMFTYTRRRWLLLCKALAHFDPETRRAVAAGSDA